MINCRYPNAIVDLKARFNDTHYEKALVWIPMQHLKKIKIYLGQDLGDFYAHSTNRLLLYPFFFSFFLVECATFWLFYLGPGFVVDYMAFTTVYTLHKAAVYTICILVADMLAHHLVPAWGGYEKRSVGRQWLIWSVGLAAGFILQRTMVKSLVPVYAPDVVAYFVAHPQARLSTLTLLLVLIPYWCLVVVLTLRVALSRQRIQRLSNSLMVIPSDEAARGASPAADNVSLPDGILRMSGHNGNGAIALADITHVTVEDHYCRINYSTDNGLKSTMIRLPLKEMLPKLPGAYFLRIHRSHVVNKGHIAGIAKKGRDHKVVLQQFDVELPVSRSRLKDLLPELARAGRLDG